MKINQRVVLSPLELKRAVLDYLRVEHGVIFEIDVKPISIVPSVFHDGVGAEIEFEKVTDVKVETKV